MPQTDTYKLLASLVVAVFLVIGGFIALVYIYLMGPVDRDATTVTNLISGFIGFAINFLFQTNTASAVRAQTRNDLLTNTGEPSGPVDVNP